MFEYIYTSTCVCVEKSIEEVGEWCERVGGEWVNEWVSGCEEWASEKVRVVMRCTLTGTCKWIITGRSQYTRHISVLKNCLVYTLWFYFYCPLASSSQITFSAEGLCENKVVCNR